jgi:pimeloyl-ACP methyl ester carboxylesterase
LKRQTLITFVWLSCLLTLSAVTANGFVTPGALAGNLSAPLAANNCEPDSVQASGAIYRICMPSAGNWNGDLVVYAHGYVASNQPVVIPEDQLILPDGTALSEIVNSLGFAFATTSYRTNGLVVRDGVADLVDLVNIFIIAHGAPSHVYLAGVSEGGLITTLAIEQYSNVFDGGLASCGPIGDFREQINYFGHFRVVFDYFFPGLIPGSPIDIPPSLIDNWDSHYATIIKPAVLDPANADAVTQLLHVTGAAFDPSDPATKEASIDDLLWYNIFATNDAMIKLGGQPFDNQAYLYTGSSNDAQLNLSVQRFSASPSALAELEAYYQTTGQLTAPLVTLHTTLDPITPYWHETLYRGKVIVNDNIAKHDHTPITRYGHCNFTTTEVLGAFVLLVDRVLNPPPYYPSSKQFLPLIFSKAN